MAKPSQRILTLKLVETLPQVQCEVLVIMFINMVVSNNFVVLNKEQMNHKLESYVDNNDIHPRVFCCC